ncbi:MAG: DUF3857 domain-containing protein [Cyclobacteriaceae bacterium]|nr:DUF3857 domain-containing protein [Cyclobacteriaceae bacterium]
MKYVLTLITAFIVVFVKAQLKTIELGKVSKEELTMTTYDKDLEAEAVVLYDKGESYFFDTDTGFEIRFSRINRTKILTKAGVKFAEVSIPYYVDGYGQTEKVVSIEAYSYNFENGNLIKKALDNATIYEEKINERWMSKKFVFPNVKEGSIIEYKYELETPFQYNLPDWNFQSTIPTVYSEYVVNMIPFYEYQYIVQGTKEFTYNNSESAVGKDRYIAGSKYRDMVNTYVMESVPAFRDESFITSKDDYIIKIDFQLAKVKRLTGAVIEIITNWKELNERLLKHDNFGKYIQKSEKYAKALFETTLNIEGKTEDEKAKLIIEYVKSAYSWDGYQGKFASKKFKEFTTQKTGNTGNINLFLIGLLKAASVNAEPVILSTRNHGKVSAPFLKMFNYVIPLIKTEKQSFYADASEPLLAYNRTPIKCLNDKALQIKKGEVEWYDLYLNEVSLENNSINITIDPNNNTAKTTLSIQETEYDAYLDKRKFGNDSTKVKKYFLSKGFQDIDKTRIVNYTKNHRPFIIAVDGTVELEKIDGKLIVSPFLKLPLSENLLKQKTRTYPIDFIYKTNTAYSTTVNFPANYNVLTVPDDFKMANELAEIEIKYEVLDTKIQVTGNYNFKKAIYNPNDYKKLKFYMNTIVRKFNEQIVLEEIVK